MAIESIQRTCINVEGISVTNTVVSRNHKFQVWSPALFKQNIAMVVNSHNFCTHSILAWIFFFMCHRQLVWLCEYVCVYAILHGISNCIYWKKLFHLLLKTVQFRSVMNMHNILALLILSTWAVGKAVTIMALCPSYSGSTYAPAYKNVFMYAFCVCPETYVLILVCDSS